MSAVLSDRRIKGPQSWYGPAMARQPEVWTHQLSGLEIDALRTATRQAMVTGKPIVELRQADFPIGAFASTLAEIRTSLLKAHGFCLIRGLPVDEMDRQFIAITFWGIGTHLGAAVSQNGKGHVLGHVKDLGLDYDDPQARGYQTSARLPYHTDYADLVGLLCLKISRSGGNSSLVSSVTVYNEMLRRRPDLVEVLRQPFYRTRWGEVGSDRPPWVEVPAFNLHEQGVVTTYVRSAVRKAQLMPEVPRLTDEQLEAMDLFDAIANDPANHLDMSFERGDIQFVNNHWLLHSRTAYDDHVAPEDKRHLLRLWLACDDGPPFPPAMTKSFQGLTWNGRPNGIHIPGVPYVAPLDAV